MKARFASMIGLAIAAVSVVGLGVGGYGMAQRLAHRTDLSERPMVWFAEPVIDSAFVFAGHDGEVNMVEAPPPASNPDDPFLHVVEWPGATRHLTIAWRGHTVCLPIVGKDQPAFPDLMRFEDWLRIAPMVVAKAESNAQITELLREHKAQPRLVVSARYPAEGFDPESWGLVRRQDWPYVFVELRGDGPDESAVTVSRATYRELEDLFSPGTRSKPTTLTHEQKMERYWQHSAMLQVTPAVLYRARDKQVEAGMRAMGWTWPVTGVSVMGVIAGLGVFFASRVRR
jgi:hypothetical protein